MEFQAISLYFRQIFPNSYGIIFAAKFSAKVSHLRRFAVETVLHSSLLVHFFQPFSGHGNHHTGRLNIDAGAPGNDLAHQHAANLNYLLTEITLPDIICWYFESQVMKITWLFSAYF